MTQRKAHNRMTQGREHRMPMQGRDTIPLSWLHRNITGSVSDSSCQLAPKGKFKSPSRSIKAETPSLLPASRDN